MEELIKPHMENECSVRLMFEDEARFGRINDPRRCWAPWGIRPQVGRQIVREYTYTYAVVSPHDGILDSMIIPEVNADAMSLFLQEVGARHPEEFIIMFMDRAGWHTAKELKVPGNISIQFLPPYSSELNPVEHLWEEIREKWFRNYVFDSIDAVENQLMESLVALESDNRKLASLTGFEWIINARLNAI